MRRRRRCCRLSGTPGSSSPPRWATRPRCTRRDARRAGSSRSRASRSPLSCGVRPSAVVFTSGGTEADNLAVKGLFWSRRRAVGAGRVLASAIEHHAVLDPVEWLAEEQEAAVTWLRRRRGGPGGPGVGRRRPGRARRRRPVHRDVGEQRGRHGPAGGGDRRPVPRGRRSVPHRRGAGARPPADRPRCPGRGCRDDQQPQDRRPVRRRCAHRRSPHGAHARPARRRAGARDPLGHARRPGHRGLRRRGRARRVGAARPDGAPASSFATSSSPACSRPFPTRSSTATRARVPTSGCPATCTCPSPAARATCCSCCSTPPASTARPGRPARPASPSRATSCWRWASTSRCSRSSLRFSLGESTTQADVDAVAGGPAGCRRAGPSSGVPRVPGGLTCASSRPCPAASTPRSPRPAWSTPATRSSGVHLALSRAGVAPPGRAVTRLLHPRRCARRPAGGRHAGDPLLRVGPVRAVRART